jgi:quinone-modifying oxidoreductase, subunit QmoC
MAGVLIQPDLEFKREIMGLDAHDLSSCYQCGTCSAVCPISTADNPFPRKEMVWVQWGLKERVLSNPSIWLCHQCGVCNAYCPRDAKPANLMAALRDYSIGYYAVPNFMGRWLEAPRYLPLLLLIPAVILLTMVTWSGNLVSLPEGEVIFAKFIPDFTIEVVYSVAVGLAIFGGALGGLRYWSAMTRSLAQPAKKPRPFTRFVSSIREIFQHRQFAACTADPAGTKETHKEHLRKTHLLVFYGFLGLVVTTTSVWIGQLFFNYYEPYPLWHPVKILGNVSGIAVVGALTVFFVRRIVDGTKAGKSTYSDWLFLTILALTALTGYANEALRLADVRLAAYPMYFIHLVLAFFLLVYFPYSKFAHVVYRTAAMLFTAGLAAPSRDAPTANGMTSSAGS